MDNFSLVFTAGSYRGPREWVSSGLLSFISGEDRAEGVGARNLDLHHLAPYVLPDGADALGCGYGVSLAGGHCGTKQRRDSIVVEIRILNYDT